MTSSEDEARQWQWIFRALWSAAPKLILDPDSGCRASSMDDLSSRRRRCRLHLLVPDTVLFERGMPSKWVGCDAEGTVVRKPFFQSSSTSGYGDGHTSSTTYGRAGAPAAAESRHPALAMPAGTGRHQSPPSRATNEFEVNERLDAVVGALLSFAAALPAPSSADGTNKGQNPPVCVARYNDGSAELLSETSLRSLCGFHNWRASLCALQAFVRPASQARNIVGTYVWRDERRKMSRRRHHPVGPRDEPRQELRATTGSSGGDNAHGTFSTLASSLGTSVVSEVEQKGGRKGTAVDGAASRSPPDFSVSPAAVNQATEDVAFVTDLSYAWPEELSPCVASPKSDSDTASIRPPQDIEHMSSLGARDLASHAGTNRPGVQPVLVVGGSGQQRSKHRHPWPKSPVRVSRLEAEFVVDQGGCLWFTNVTKVHVQSVRRTPKKVVDDGKHRLQLQRAKEKAVQASSVAARELRAVIGLASRRGLNAEEIFRHFAVDDEESSDPGRGKGDRRRAGKKEIVRGMAGLGVSVSEEAASLLIETILRSRAGSSSEVSTQFTITSSLFGDSEGLPRSVVGNRVGSASGAHSEKLASRRERGISGKPSAERVEDMSLSALRQYVTAKDLWSFAHRELEHCPTAPGKQAATPPKGKRDNLHLSPQEKAGALDVSSPHRLAREDLGRSPKRRRTRTSGCRGGDSATQTAGRDRMSSEKLRSTEGAHRERRLEASTALGGISGSGKSVPERISGKTCSAEEFQQSFGSLQASLPTTPCLPAIGNHGATTTMTAAHLSTGYNGVHEARQMSTPTHLKRGVQDARGPLEIDPKLLSPGRGFSNVGGQRLPPLAGMRLGACENVELVSFPCDNPAFEAMNGKDRVFHVDRGLVIAYRVLRHEYEANSVGRPSNMESPPPAVGAEGAEPDSSSSGPRFQPTLMVVIPGLFQTLNTLEKALFPLLVAHPRLTILLVAPPGMPNTHWPAGASLTGELTAMCVSTLLEHLGEGGELLPTHNNDPKSPMVKPDESHAARPRQTDPETSDAHLAAAAQPGEGGVQAVTATSPEGDKGDAASFEFSASIQPNEPTFRPSYVEPSPVIFVGFGSGANAIVNLAAAPLRTPPKHLRHECIDHGGGRRNSTPNDIVKGGDADDRFSEISSARGSRAASADGGGISEQERHSPTGDDGSQASDGLLVSMLRRQGLRIGGLVLVNGFISLDEQSTQVLHTLRQAFCDQSDGRARSEAVASLLLSENHLATETAAAAATPAATTTKTFLETREAFRLGADVSALARPQMGGVRSKENPASVTGSANASPPRQMHSRALPKERGRREGDVTVTSVLREMGVNNQKRKRRLLRRQRRREEPVSCCSRRRQRNIADTDISSGCDSFEKEYPKGGPPGSDEDEERGTTTDDDVNDGRRSPPQQRSSIPGSGPSCVDVHDPASRLALAASVSTLSGLLESSNDTGCGGDAGDSVLCGSGSSGSVGAASSRILGAVKRAKLPLVMVQSTEDALIGSPLALILKRELSPEDGALAEAETVLDCLKPLRAPSGRVERKDEVAKRSSGSGEEHTEENDEGKGLLDVEGGQARGEGTQEGLLTMHTCWVKAGHDVLHERGPFMRALLHKTIYACHGHEAPPARFPDEKQGDANNTADATVNAHSNDPGVNVDNPSSCGKVELPGMLLPSRQVEATADNDDDNGEEGQLQRADRNDQNDSCSQEARSTAYRCGRGEAADADGSSPTAHDLGGVIDDGGRATIGGVWGTSLADLEINNSESGHHLSLSSRGAGAADGSAAAAVAGTLRTASTATTASGTAGSSSLSSAATSVVVGRAPKLLDFFDSDDEGSRSDFREATLYVEKFREFDLDRAILEKGLGATGECLAALNLPLVARYTFQTMKDCWRTKMLVVEAARLDLGMRKRQADTREQLALSIRAVNNMSRILRKSNNHGGDTGNNNNNNNEDGQSNVESNLLHLEPLDQRALKVEIAAAEITRATHYHTCRRLRRTAAVFRARRERLESTLAYSTAGVRGTLVALERIMGQLRKNITLARIQERVFHEEVVKAESHGLKARHRLTVVKGKLATLAVHRHKWTDSDAWQPGYVQRLETAELIKILTAEGRQLQSTADAAEALSERARELHSKVSQQEAGLASTMEGVGALFSLLNSALEDESFVQDPEAAVEAQTALEHDVLGPGDDLGRDKGGWRRKRGGRGKRGPQDVAARVRSTPHRSRTHAEKSWVALDAVVTPQLYHHVTLAEAEEMRWDALYHTRLDREDVLRIMALPPQVQLALPFLHTPDEVAAHELLMRYSLGINAGHFARLDQNSQDVTGNSKAASSSSSCGDHSASLAEAASAAGAGRTTATGGMPTGGGKPANVEENGDFTGATHRVLTCMRRAAEAKLKIAGERDQEEAVWCVLDRKLRPDLYRESDEAAGDRNEALHSEADAREDARHPWLSAPEETKTAGNNATTSTSRASGGASTFSNVVKQTKAAGDAAITKVVARDHEAIAMEIGTTCTVDYVKRLAAAAAGGSLAGIEEQAVANQEEAQGPVISSAEVKMAGNGTSDADGASGQNIGHTEGNADFDLEAVSEKSESKQSEHRGHHAETEPRVLSRFLVAEEETPPGRDMTRSLAMLQEVVLRLIGGERNIFSGLNPHTALAATRFRTLTAGSAPTSASLPGADSGGPGSASSGSTAATSEATTGATGGNGEGEGPMFQGETTGSVLAASSSGTASRGTTATPSLPNESTPSSGVGPGSQQQSRATLESSLEGVPLLDGGVPCGGESIASGGGTSAMSDTPRRLAKVFGSWEEVHPAALGIGSQEKGFSAREGGGGSAEHPASYRRNAATQGSSIGSSTLSSPLTASGFTAHHTTRNKNHHGIICSPPLDPLDILTGEGLPDAVPGWLSCEASGESNLVASGMDKVGELDPGEVQRRGLLVASRQRTCLLDIKTSELQAGQSKAYAFQVGPYDASSGSSIIGSSGDDSSTETHPTESETASANSSAAAAAAKVVVGIAVTVVYQGNFEAEGYRLGRLAAGLYRVPPKVDNGATSRGGNELPQPVGFAPYSLQSLNTPESMGRILIFHQPRVQPVRAGRFQLVLGAASRVRYSISIVAVNAADAMAAFNDSVKDAQRMQKRLPSLLKGMEDLKATSKLSRWKQRVVRELLEEAREEAVRCDGEINEVKREIQEEENDQKLDDEGRRALLAEARDLNAEISRWKKTFASRVQEGKDLRAGMETIQSKLKCRQDEEADLRKKLAEARRSLPAAAFVLKNQREATDVALALNATVDKYSGAAAKWAAADLLKERGEVVLSPADRVRRALKEEGWDALTVEEKRFTMLDRVLRPDLYQWMKASRLNEQGDAVLAPEVPIALKRRKDSLAALIGPGPIGTKSLEGAENVEEAMQARKKQGWSKKATEFATPSAWSGKSKATLDNAGDAGIGSGSTAGALTARSDATSGGALTARSGAAGIKSLTLADEWRLRDFSFSAMELERVRTTPFHRLQRKELKARKLLGRFHCDNHHDRKGKESAEKIAREAEIRCASVRAKDKALRTQEESEWVEIDKKLFPEVWRQKNRQEDRLRRFNMTLTSIPKPSTASGDSDDSEEESEGNRDHFGSIGGRSGQSEWRAEPGGNPGSRNSRWRSAECPFDRDEIIQIWASDAAYGGKHKRAQQQHQGKRGEDRMADREGDVRRVRELLLSFNGPLSTFARESALRDSQETMDGGPPTLSTSKRIAYCAAQQYLAATAYARDHADRGPPGSARGPGPDETIIALLRELMTAKAIHSKYMDTNVAHGTAQRFSTEHYAKELEREIAAQLREQILERERAVARDASDLKHEEASVSASSDDEDENWEVGFLEEASLADKDTNAGETARGGRATTSGAKASRRQANISIQAHGNHDNGSHDTKYPRQGGSGRGECSHTSAGTFSPSAPKHGGGGGVTGGSGGAEKKAWHDVPIVEEFTHDEVNDLVRENPAWEGCRACRTLPCRWCSCVDYRSIGSRKTQIRDELFRLMGLWDHDEVVTTVPLSCVRGGPTSLLRTEAVSELRWEAKELDRQLHLAAVDKELHDAYACTHEAIEVQSLHEYSTLMWTKDAQVALSKERELTLARTTSLEAVDDLLESMLDGWVFGERQGEHAAGGIIPAVKTSGPLRPGDQRRAVAYLEHRHRLRRIAHAKGERLPEEVKGTQHTKALPIDDIAQQRILHGRATKRKEDQKHLLRETETTMKFGLFSMVQSYLHAMTLVQREKEAWSGKGDVMTRDGNSSVYRPPMTSERKKMVEEEVKARERATTRKKFLDRARKAEERSELREAKNKRRVSQRKALRILEIRERDKAARNIQRVFRGFRGKVFAQRWALKRAEVEALKSVLHEAAVNVQRAFRGHLGRVEASEVRMELAEYIADIRVKEAESDIVDFWKTHRLKARKDELKKTLLNTIGKPLVAMRRKKLE